jgi:16S rRNA (cytidine1402-2'-O)-methyltransferase
MATVYLIPTPLHANGWEHLHQQTLNYLQACTHLFCESIKTARQLARGLDKAFPIDNKAWYSIHKNDIVENTQDFKKLLTQEVNIAILSEAGCPAIADPGNVLVQLAHQAGAKVMPITGPSSIMLALMASGFNGQQFSFVGYLPAETGALKTKLKQLEQDSQKNNSTYIFIETPFRNTKLWEQILNSLQPHTRVCVAANLTGGQEQYVLTQTVTAWKKMQPPIHKQNSIFLLYAGT